MNKKIVRIVILLSGVSLLGIVALQFIWFDKMLGMREDQFDRDVKAALQETAKRIEKDEGIYFLADRLKNITNVDTTLAPSLPIAKRLPTHQPSKKLAKQRPTPPPQHAAGTRNRAKPNSVYNRVVIISNGKSDTIYSEIKVDEQMPDIVQMPFEPLTFWPEPPADWFFGQQVFPPIFNQEFSNAQNEQQMKLELEMMRRLDSLRFQFMQSEPSLNGYNFVLGDRPPKPKKEPRVQPASDPEKEQLNNQIVTLEKQKRKLNDALSRMMLEIKGLQAPSAINLNIPGTRDILSNELASRNIIIPFEYVVISGSADTLSRSSGFNPKSENSLYQANLFSDRIFETSDRIALYFPDKQNLLYKSMFWLLVASLGFTLIIISTFVFSIQVIIRQKKISEVKSDFINNMTHEFKTPIATISLAADSIVNPRVMADPERIHYYTRVIKEENKRMNNQVESVLQMALLDKKDFSLNLQALDVHDLITQAIQNISLQIEKRNGNISFDLEALDSTALVDEVHFLNVLFNLLDNANKYSPQKPDINIKTTNLEGKLLIKVSDKGMGMDKETKGRIFEKFYRKSTGNVHNVKGFGLGLSYVKAIVAATNGEIWVESEPEKGSCFTIEIPVYHGN